WRHNKLPMPVCGAMAARPGDAMPPAVAAEGAAVARDLAARIVALYRTGAVAACSDPRLAGALIFVQWRLSRMCQMRADAHDARRETEQAMAENARARELDDLNAAYARIRRTFDSVAWRGNSNLTPREGLRLGLERADFRLARMFAQKVLAAEPENAQANFAMGMAYFVEEQFSRAEVYLKRCLEQRPDEPATLNNLAVSQLRQGRLAEAETNAVRAVELLPDSPELRRTLEAIRRYRENPRDDSSDRVVPAVDRELEDRNRWRP
ncbi:MAG: tetratricopeptide repeat protein, partial [Kiritimatiellia bacterium]